MGRTTLMHRDRNDLLTLKQAPGSAEGVTYHYDANGNPNRMSGPLGIEDSRDYYSFGWDSEFNVLRSVTDDAVGTAGGMHDARGNLETAVMMDGRSYTFTSDERGLRQTMEIGGRVTQYGYDERATWLR